MLKKHKEIHSNVKRSFANKISHSQISSLEIPVFPKSLNVNNILNPLKRRNAFTEIDTGKFTNDSHNPPKMMKLSNECNEIDMNHKDVLRTEFLENSTVLDLYSHGVLRTHSFSTIVMTKSNDVLENADFPILQSIDFDKNKSSHDLNSLNWEVKQYISCERNETEVVDLIQNLAEIYLQLSVKHFATESVLQGVMNGMYSVFDSCKAKFTELLSYSNVNDKDNVISIAFNSHDPKNGILRSTFTRKQYYKKEYNFIQPIEVPILDDDGKETQCYFSYVPVLETIKTWLLNDNVRPFCINPRKSTTAQGLFDVKDGNKLSISKNS
ncbi:hypothetical protein TSAR_015938 [Trichomalopsis sarcophagae]|uniref:Uncharacterized protein n=1 Tax=Trichomalopsis sarcophagae TaxID=543379 RepID=A0A232F184_9HYME|nr:hypothetical protein TSAR_015938 [Trichomalopsis sarcophagae]